jgi:hypothetical protein
MRRPLILLHVEALRATHPVFAAAPTEAHACFVWDDGFLQSMDYSLKRLVFLYETLCELPVDIRRGDTQAVVQALEPSAIYLPAAHDPRILAPWEALRHLAPLHIIEDEPFARLKKPVNAQRFFQYWKKAEKSALQPHGGMEE